MSLTCFQAVKLLALWRLAPTPVSSPILSRRPSPPLIGLWNRVEGGGAHLGWTWRTHSPPQHITTNMAAVRTPQRSGLGTTAAPLCSPAASPACPLLHGLFSRLPVHAQLQSELVNSWYFLVRGLVSFSGFIHVLWVWRTIIDFSWLVRVPPQPPAPVSRSRQNWTWLLPYVKT